MSPEYQMIGAITLAIAGCIGIGWFVHWLVSVPHEEIQTNFETLKERNDK